MRDGKYTDRNGAFDDLFNSYAKGLVLYARRFVGTPEEAQDIVHDVFVRLWERLGSLSDENIRSWLFVVTRNRCLDRLSKLRRGSEYRKKIAEENAWLEQNLDLFVESDAMRHIMRAIDRLPPQRKRVFTMNKLDGMTFAQIAGELGISPRTVDKHVEMALRFLRAELSGTAMLLLLQLLCVMD